MFVPELRQRRRDGLACSDGSFNVSPPDGFCRRRACTNCAQYRSSRDKPIGAGKGRCRGYEPQGPGSGSRFQARRRKYRIRLHRLRRLHHLLDLQAAALLGRVAPVRSAQRSSILRLRSLIETAPCELEALWPRCVRSSRTSSRPAVLIGKPASNGQQQPGPRQGAQTSGGSTRPSVRGRDYPSLLGQRP